MRDRASGRFEQRAVKIGEAQVVSAADELFNHFDHEQPMWAAYGDRSVRVSFKFTKRFQNPPALTLGVTGIDCDHSRNLRYRVSAENVTPLGFEVLFVTWDDSRIARASVAWQAVGQTYNIVDAAPSKPSQGETQSPKRVLETPLKVEDNKEISQNPEKRKPKGKQRERKNLTKSPEGAR